MNDIVYVKPTYPLNMVDNKPIQMSVQDHIILQSLSFVIWFTLLSFVVTYLVIGFDSFLCGAFFGSVALAFIIAAIFITATK